MLGKEFGAMQLANRYVLYSAAAGLVPVPVFDLAAIAAVQVRMVGQLAKYYGLPGSTDRGKALVSALIGGAVPTTLGYGMVGSLVRRVPVVGPIVGLVTVPAFASASTYAVARVFIQHFESGGTFLDFDPEKVREYYQSELQSASA
jgi:uncharacterized protein (DUF697 family)